MSFAQSNEKRYTERTMDGVRASEWLDNLAVHGRASFTSNDAVAGLGPTPTASRMALSRLLKSGRIASPYRGFYVVVAPEHRRLGCSPPEHFLDQLMTWLGVPYYIALLSAAAHHGAAHQAPLRMQVMVPKARHPIRSGEVGVDFIVRADLESTPVVTRTGPRGYLRIASAEATALELVGYDDRCGGLDHVATVLAELAEVLQPDALATAAALCPVAWVQRLGWLLERVDQPSLAEALVPEVARRATVQTRLLPSASGKGAPRDDRWRLIVNTEVEVDDL